jgi:hypothetical protein
LIAGLIIAFAIFWRHKKKRTETAKTVEEEKTIVNLTSINDDLEREARPRRFSYND